MADRPITDAGVIEQIRNALPTATQDTKGLMPQGLPLVYDYYNRDASLNTLKASGFYAFDDKIVREGAPTGWTNYCVIVIRVTGYSILQIIFNSHRRIMMRVLWPTPNEWKEI